MRTAALGEGDLWILARFDRLTKPHPKVDAMRGCVAFEASPVVYCLESVDQPGLHLDELAPDVGAPLKTLTHEELGVGTVEATAVGLMGDGSDAAEVTAVPYAVWANREPGAMRVWIPAERASLA
ncbi:MAG TPA: hypothetical protein VFN97_27615 [Actinospica sp.]|nr:hypothetical protein [Actinospica sp.]